MSRSSYSATDPALDRRDMLRWGTALAGAARVGISAAHAQQGGDMQSQTAAAAARTPDITQRMIGYMLAHEQFPLPELVQIGAAASRAGFHLLATSDHLQPWQSNEGHSGEAWVTLGALGAQASHSWMGTTVTCPIIRYNPAVVAEAFASLSRLYPGRIFLGVGSGEALNERAATGTWPNWQERWDRLVESMTIIRRLWNANRCPLREIIIQSMGSCTIHRLSQFHC